MQYITQRTFSFTFTENEIESIARYLDLVMPCDILDAPDVLVKFHNAINTELMEVN